MKPPADFGFRPTKGKESDSQIRPNLKIQNESALAFVK